MQEITGGAGLACCWTPWAPMSGATDSDRCAPTAGTTSRLLVSRQIEILASIHRRDECGVVVKG